MRAQCHDGTRLAEFIKEFVNEAAPGRRVPKPMSD